MSNYRKGANAEREFMEKLRKEGHEAVRSAGSHSPVDVVGIVGTSVTLYQIKSTKLTFSQRNVRKVVSRIGNDKILAFKQFAPAIHHEIVLRFNSGRWLFINIKTKDKVVFE